MLGKRRIEVAAALRPWVEDLTESWATAAMIVTEEPDHATALILRSTPGQPPQVIVTGPRTRALHLEGGPGVSCLRARLRPGRAKALFGRAVGDLVDRAVPLGDLWDPAPDLAGLRSDPDAFAAALAGAAAPGMTDVLLQRAARMLPAIGVRASAERLHVSERHLRNLVVDRIGLPPKRFARIERVRQILAQGPARSWSRLALAAGYYDHSHMTAEFRAIMGMPPTTFFSGVIAPNVRCDGPFQAAELLAPQQRTANAPAATSL